MRNPGSIWPWAPVILLGVTGLGVSILVWLAPVPADAYTPAQESLLAIADWMVKASVGALLGFAGGRAAARHVDSSSG